MYHVCEYCVKKFKTKSLLNAHQKNAKYCLEIQGNICSGNFACHFCYRDFPDKNTVLSHHKNCVTRKYLEYKNQVKNV
jgi:hypothetical protein